MSVKIKIGKKNIKNYDNTAEHGESHGEKKKYVEYAGSDVEDAGSDLEEDAGSEEEEEVEGGDAESGSEEKKDDTEDAESDEMNIIDFCDTHSIPWIPINMEVKNGKKILNPYTETNKRASCKDILVPSVVKSRRKLIAKYDYIWIDTRNIQQIDVDGDCDPELKTPYFLSATKKKPHYFVLGFSQVGKARVDTRWKKVELLCGQPSYAKKTDVVYNVKTSFLDYSLKVDNVLGNITRFICKENAEDEESIEKIEDVNVLDITDSTPNANTENQIKLKNTEGEKMAKEINPEMRRHLCTIFGTVGDWKVNSYKATPNLFYCFPSSDTTCLVDGTKKHSAVQSWCIVTKTRCTAKCITCSPNKIMETKLHASEWKGIKESFGLVDVKEDDEKVKYDDMLDFLDNYCDTEDIMKKNGNMMRRSKNCPIEYEIISSYGDFLDTLFKTADEPLKRFYRKVCVKDNLEKYLINVHLNITILKRDKNIMAFNNGYLKLDEFTFCDYDGDKKYTFIGKKYIPFDFDPNWLKMEWTDVKCPIFDKIINDQPELSSTPEVKMVFYGFLGRLHFPVNNDNIHACPYLIGTSGTGKSVITDIISSTFSPESIGVINYSERCFGKTGFLTNDVIIDSDTPANMISLFNKTDFQKCVSGETIAIPVKNQKQETQHKVTQQMLFCSQYMQEVQDTGEIMRRLAYFGFQPIENADGNLKNKCIQEELHLVFLKTILAYKKMITHFQNKPFHEWKIPYFQSRSEDILMENNAIYRMISQSENLMFKKGKLYPFEDFLEQYTMYYSTRGGKKAIKPKVTDVIFSKLNNPVIKKSLCKSCRNVFKNNLHEKCCEDSSDTNKFSTYFIENMTFRDSFRDSLRNNESPGDNLQ
jgi:hypothetical protein